eukprot:scaffold267830_cov32-Tisochrysis_lutea.AAC.2
MVATRSNQSRPPQPLDTPPSGRKAAYAPRYEPPNTCSGEMCAAPPSPPPYSSRYSVSPSRRGIAASPRSVCCTVGRDSASTCHITGRGRTASDCISAAI